MAKVVIAGGGIGGLTAALAFDHCGWDAAVLERADAIGEVGAGIQISPNGMQVLCALGLGAQVEAAGFHPRAAEFRGGTSGALIFREAMTGYAAKYGAPYIHIHRADLIAILYQALEERLPGAVRTGQSVTGYVQDGDGVSAVLTDGSRVAGDLLIGADGIHSTIRNQMLEPEKPRFTGTRFAGPRFTGPRFTGNMAWRATVPVDKLGGHAPAPNATLWFGNGKHAVTYLLRGGRLANFVGVVERDDWQSESWTEQGTRAQAMADFAGWHPIVTRLIAKADAHYRWALFDHKPLKQWTDDRVALLGDACHPMLPFMAQGAVQAMEDAYVLATLAAEAEIMETALEAYFARRQPRTARVQMAARKNMDLFHQKTPLGKLQKHGAMMAADRLKLDVADRRLNWLYGHDVTA